MDRFRRFLGRPINPPGYDSNAGQQWSAGNYGRNAYQSFLRGGNRYNQRQQFGRQMQSAYRNRSQEQGGINRSRPTYSNPYRTFLTDRMNRQAPPANRYAPRPPAPGPGFSNFLKNSRPAWPVQGTPRQVQGPAGGPVVGRPVQPPAGGPPTEISGRARNSRRGNF